MNDSEDYDHILIREASILVRVPRGVRDLNKDVKPEFYDVRSGVPLKHIYPELQAIELHRGHLLAAEDAHGILKWAFAADAAFSGLDKVVNILDIKQRRLDSVVADSILDQVRVISDLLKEFLSAAENAQKEERFWLSQQVLGLVRRFSGRELSELQETVEWFKNRCKK
jgi:hypothetical protein